MKFLAELTARFVALGHTPTPWRKNCNGSGMHCRVCGAHVGCVAYKKSIHEFPEDTCAERLASVAKFDAEWKAKQK